MTRPLITLTTDFGLSDHFVGVMKGVILNIQPSAQVIDISHGIRPYEIADGAFTIAQAYRYFPKKTIHVIVVDPGVGSARRPLLAEMAGQYFIAPDNGVLSMVLAREQSGSSRPRIRHITAERYFLHPVSRTFHGRDVFSPVAAHLAAGIPPAKFGPRIDDFVRVAFDQPEQTGKSTWTGVILKTDHFGNLVTNFAIDQFPAVRTHAFSLLVGVQKIARLALTFSECAPGDPFVLVGSSGYLEIAVSEGSAVQALGCGAGSPVKLTIY
ncbi:MAG TPA: SAM-dependent chlorinase/fluorinase [Bryobacteraceae bacterium]|nr:SAM-dependent chlorinase/fluorinase [Bryobacteraceae bacterium]